MTLTTESLSTSASTWADDPARLELPPELALPARRGVLAMLTDPAGRARGLATRFRIRQDQAETFFAASRNPERGLPVAENAKAFRFIRSLLSTRRGLLVAVVVFNVLAATAGLVVPWMLGDLVDQVSTGGAALATIDAIILGVACVVVAQALLTFAARRMSVVFGYDLLAAAREAIVRTVLGLPLGRVESASSGDLLTRITSDVSKMSESVRWGFPQLVMSVVVTALTLVAMVLNSWFLALPLVLSITVLVLVTRVYLRRAMPGYITESGTYSQINSTMTETIEGARTVEALGLHERRTEIGEDDIELSNHAERYTMTLRNLLFIFLDASYQLPLVAVVVLGTWGYANDWVTIGQITAAAIYVQQLVEPLDRLIQVADRLQIGLAATTRLLGIAEVPQDRVPGTERPTDNHLAGHNLRFAYREGRDVLHGIDLDLRPGERLAVVGPSGSGKSTLGRLMAGINGPRTGSVQVGGVQLMSLPLDVLRTEVALVTQEHHVFVGTVRDNIVLARDHQLTPEQGDAAVVSALRAVDAMDWVQKLPHGLDTMLGHGRTQLTPAQAQQVALARLVVADPHTLVLDEATSLIDPRTARHLEGSMAALLSGRTVMAIAHRLHTAHDADRIAVVIDGRIQELGSHQELLELNGEYARLWHTWRS